MKSKKLKSKIQFKELNLSKITSKVLACTLSISLKLSSASITLVSISRSRKRITLILGISFILTQERLESIFQDPLAVLNGILIIWNAAAIKSILQSFVQASIVLQLIEESLKKRINKKIIHLHVHARINFANTVGRQFSMKNLNKKSQILVIRL